MSERVVVFGTGSFAEIVHFYLTHDSDFEVAAFTVNESHLRERELFGLPVVPFERLEESYPPSSFKMYVAVGYKQVNKVRREIYAEAKSRGYELVSYVSSKATYWGDSTIGDNCFIQEDNTIQPFVTIGNNVVMWSGNHIGHHSTIGDHCFITSHVVVSGHANIGPSCFLGVNATIRDSISVGEACVIGAGALIMRPTEAGEVYLGSRTEPARLTSEELAQKGLL